MTSITVRYSALASGHDGLQATWGRIEGHLRELDGIVGGTADMSAEALTAYQALKARWSAAADERQLALQSLAELVRAAGEHYRSVDAALAAQFV
jgi:uncharacterized protein YukE